MFEGVPFVSGERTRWIFTRATRRPSISMTEKRKLSNSKLSPPLGMKPSRSGQNPHGGISGIFREGDVVLGVEVTYVQGGVENDSAIRQREGLFYNVNSS